MLRERVDIHGHVRPMEAQEDMSVLNLPIGSIGLIKEGPALKWLKGQDQWDKQFRRQAENAVKQREKIKNKVENMLVNARDQGFVMVGEHPDDNNDGNLKDAKRLGNDSVEHHGDGIIQIDRRWGPLDLEDEKPPPSAIAKRRDTVSTLQHR